MIQSSYNINTNPPLIYWLNIFSNEKLIGIRLNEIKKVSKLPSPYITTRAHYFNCITHLDTEDAYIVGTSFLPLTGSTGSVCSVCCSLCSI